MDSHNGIECWGHFSRILQGLYRNTVTNQTLLIALEDIMISVCWGYMRITKFYTNHSIGRYCRIDISGFLTIGDYCHKRFRHLSIGDVLASQQRR